MENQEVKRSGRRGFLAGVATAAAAVLLARFGARGVTVEDRVQPTEPGRLGESPKLPPPKGSVKRRG